MKKVGRIHKNLLNGADIYQSDGLEKHIQKRHPECVEYLDNIPDVISNPDYVGKSPRENANSIELIKVLEKNITIGIKLDTVENYYYVATLYAITDSKLQARIKSGRIKKFDN
jgi:hypothetical protein